MRFAFAFVPLLGLVASLPPAMAQERITTPLTESIAREAARLGTEAALAAQDGSASAMQANSSRPAETLPTGTRVRVTAASLVDVPGVIRLDTPIALHAERTNAAGRILASDEASVTFRGPDGQRVTIPQPRGRVIGAIAGWNGQTLNIVRDNGSVVTVPRGEIARLERSVGQSSRLREAGWHFLAGAVIGAGATGLVAVPVCIRLRCDPGVVIALGSRTVFVAGAIGALFGAIAGPQDRWRKVDVSSLGK